MNWVCQFCKRAVPSITEGTSKKQTIKLRPTWTSSALTVMDSGEQCYPCPTCESDSEGRRIITHWEHADIRLHKRLRQHHARNHQQLLRDAYTTEEVVQFYKDARRLRCELIHGPNDRATTRQATPPKDPEPVGSPETPTRHRARNISGKDSQEINLPPSYLEWLENELRPITVASYTGITKNFLRWFEKSHGKPGVLADVWDIESVRTFLSELEPLLAPTSVYNYLCAIQTAQRFVRQRGEIEPSPATIFGFSTLFRQASRKKTRHQKVVAETKRKTSVTLHEVKERVLENKELYARFKGYVKLCKDGGSLTLSEFTWATGYALFSLQASNFKRNGNTRKIQFKPAMKRISTALKHRKACELVITNATKTGGTEVFSIVKMQRLKVLLLYATVLRPSAMGSGQCPLFFVNSLGKPITSASPYIAALGKSVGIPNLTIKDLRTRIETEAAVRGKGVDRAAIADHLAHSKATRDRHYLLMDKRRSREAAMDVEKLIDESEPLENSDVDTSMDSSVLSDDDIEYDDDSSSTGRDERSSEETDASGDSTTSSGDPESHHADIIHRDDGTSSNESKTEEFDDLTMSPTPSPSKKRERKPTGLSSESESSDGSPLLPTPLTKKARLNARNSEPTPISSREFQALLRGSPPLRTNEERDRSVTPSPSPSKKKEGSPRSPPLRPNATVTPSRVAESDESSSPGSFHLFTDVPISEGERSFSPEGKKNILAATERAHITSVSPGPTKSCQEAVLHQRPRTSSESAAINSRTDSGDERAKSEPGESSPPWTRTLRGRSYTVQKHK